jgi:hypothetical protein
MDDLKLLAGFMVYESKISKAAKLQLLNFISEASEPQVKSFILDGKITSLDRQAEKVVNERFIVSEAGGRVAKLRKTYMGMVGASFTPLWAAYRKIRSLYDVCTKKCGTFEYNTSRRQHCMIKCKVAKYQGNLAAAKKLDKKDDITKWTAKLAKAEAELHKSIQSFSKRGAEQ